MLDMPVNVWLTYVVFIYSKEKDEMIKQLAKFESEKGKSCIAAVSNKSKIIRAHPFWIDGISCYSLQCNEHMRNNCILDQHRRKAISLYFVVEWRCPRKNEKVRSVSLAVNTPFYGTINSKTKGRHSRQNWLF